MIGYRFYEELSPGGRSEGNVVAILVGTDRGDMLDAIAAAQERANAPVESTTVCARYLRQRCRRVPERRARAIHPNMFTAIERTTP